MEDGPSAEYLADNTFVVVRHFSDKSTGWTESEIPSFTLDCNSQSAHRLMSIQMFWPTKICPRCAVIEI